MGLVGHTFLPQLEEAFLRGSSSASAMDFWRGLQKSSASAMDFWRGFLTLTLTRIQQHQEGCVT